MADSDEEYERRRSRDGREKFRRERSDYERRADERRKDSWEHDRTRGVGRSRDWSGRAPERGGRDPYGRDTRRREPYERHEIAPPQKRMRREWEYEGGHRPYPMPYGGQPMHRAPAPWSHQPPTDMGAHHAHMEPFPDPSQANAPRVEAEYPTQPQMMTFKQFLGQQEDNISDQDAIKKYNMYKTDFKKQQINQFFLAHKDNEWFKTKYHPDDCLKKKIATQASLQNRLAVFRQLFDHGQIDVVSVDTDKCDLLIKLLNSVIIKLEGGSDYDLQSLEIPEPEEEVTASQITSPEAKPTETTPPVNGEPPTGEGAFTLSASPTKKKRKRSNEKKPEEPLNMDTMTDEQIQLQKAAQEFSQNIKKPGERSYSYDSGSDSGSLSDSDSDNEPAPPGLDEEGGSESTRATVQLSPALDLPPQKEVETEISEEKDLDTTAGVETTNEVDAAKVQEKKGPQPLHKTMSIFLRHLAPSITKTEVEAICKRYPGYMRVALQDPLPDRNFFRRGWVTFDRSVNIRDICWNLNNIRLRDCELNATINRELKQRVRPVVAITAHKQIVRQDIKLAAKLVTHLDLKWGLWEGVGGGGEKADLQKQDTNFGIASKNPILKNITQYLVEEGSFEEEELIGQTAIDQPKEANTDLVVERDPILLQVLDRMVLYLRIVHSTDYYSAAEFPNEDEMPHRCGIMHARSHLPPTRMTVTDINEWMHNFEARIKHFLHMRQPLDDKEIAELGRKDPYAEVDKFVTANTQELGKDKWLCPLSGKKFKGPDFVKKHILNKHQEKIEEVKKEVAYFNNYLMDPKRPQLPEHPGNRASAQSHPNPHSYPGHHYPGMMAYNHPRPPMMHGYGPGHHPPPYRGYGVRDVYRQEAPPPPRRPSIPISRRSDPRAIIDYRDLDAPDDADIF